MKDKKAITIKTLNKSNVWDIQENDVFRMWEAVEKDADLKDNMRHYTDIIKTAFEVEDIKVDKPIVIEKLEQRGFKVGTIKVDEQNSYKVAIKKRAIMRVTDLTYENVGHISAAKLVEVLERNFGGGWESLPQSIQDIILSAFDISTTTLPSDRLHKAGGLYEKKVNDGYEVLEIPKGSWTEAIFVKEKPEDEPKPVMETTKSSNDDYEGEESDEEKEEDLPEDNDHQDEDEDEDDDTFDDDKLTEESYRTTYETNPDDLNYEAEEISDDSEGDY
jgi:hypothetical protein